jgi:hypothetical protein
MRPAPPRGIRVTSDKPLLNSLEVCNGLVLIVLASGAVPAAETSGPTAVQARGIGQRITPVQHQLRGRTARPRNPHISNLMISGKSG